MRNVAIVAAGLLVAVLAGVGVWAVSDDGGRRAGALASGPDLKSPNGQYTIDVRDDGIFLNGPAGDVTITEAGVRVAGQAVAVAAETNLGLEAKQGLTVKAGTTLVAEATGNATLRAGATAKLQGALAHVIGGTSTVQGATVALGCSGGGLPVARQGDRTTLSGNGPYGAVAPGQYPIGATSSAVFAC
jgi:hypothetical protein